MIVLPFVLFFIWFVVVFKKQGFTVGSYILLLYCVISLCSIVVDWFDYYDASCTKLPLGVHAPLLYCILISFCVYPFTRIHFQNIKVLQGRSLQFFDIVVYFYFTIFLIVLLVSFEKINELLMTDNELLMSNLVVIRGELYSGTAESFYNHLTGFPRYVSAICNILSPSSFVMILFFMYSMAFLHKPALFNIIALCGSFTPLLVSINIVDRSQFLYWLLLLGLSFSLFYKFFSKKAKTGLIIHLSVVIGAILLFFSVVTIARFGERENGLLGGLFLYAGQSYINFCNFINYLQPAFAFYINFPFINDYIFHEPSYFEISARLNQASPVMVNVFSTFLGIIYSMSGLIVMILYVLVYRFATDYFLRRHIVRMYGFERLMVLWILASVPTLGLFGHFYMSSSATIAIVCWLFIGFLLSNEKITLQQRQI